MEISPDIFIQITEMGHCKLIMGQFIAHSLNMKHLLVTSFLNNRFTWKLHNAEGNLVTFFSLYIKTTNQSGNQAQTVVQMHEQRHLIKRMCSFHIAELLFRFWFLKTCCWFICLERFPHYTSLLLLPPPLQSTE